MHRGVNHRHALFPGPAASSRQRASAAAVDPRSSGLPVVKYARIRSTSSRAGRVPSPSAHRTRAAPIRRRQPARPGPSGPAARLLLAPLQQLVQPPGPMSNTGSSPTRPDGSRFAALGAGGVEHAPESTTTPYRRAPGADQPAAHLQGDESGSRSSPSPQPPPPQVTKCSTSPGLTGTSWHLLEQHLVAAVGPVHHLVPRVPGSPPLPPGVGQPAIVMDGDGARLQEPVGDVDPVAAAVQPGSAGIGDRSPTSRSAAGSTTRGIRTGC